MSDRDLTPEEARTEVQAFLGDGWMVGAVLKGPEILGSAPEIWAQRDGISVYGSGATLREAASALKRTWGVAVKPWCNESAQDAVIAHTGNLPDANKCREAVSRVLKEDS